MDRSIEVADSCLNSFHQEIVESHDHKKVNSQSDNTKNNGTTTGTGAQQKADITDDKDKNNKNNSLSAASLIRNWELDGTSSAALSSSSPPSPSASTIRSRELGRLRGVTYRADPENREKARLRCANYRADPEKRELECLKRKQRFANETPAQRENRLKKSRDRMRRIRLKAAAANATAEGIAATTDITHTRTTTQHVSSNNITADDMATRPTRHMSTKRTKNPLPVKQKKQKCNTAHNVHNWNSNYTAVKQYVESHQGRYPKKSEQHTNGSTGINLGTWVTTQKSAYNKTTNDMKLTHQKRTDLETLPNWRWSSHSSPTKPPTRSSRNSGGQDGSETQRGVVTSRNFPGVTTVRTAALKLQNEETARTQETAALAEAIKTAEEKAYQDGDNNKDPSFVWV